MIKLSFVVFSPALADHSEQFTPWRQSPNVIRKEVPLRASDALSSKKLADISVLSRSSLPFSSEATRR